MVCVALSTKLNWFCSFLSPPSPSSEPTESFRPWPPAMAEEERRFSCFFKTLFVPHKFLYIKKHSPRQSCRLRLRLPCSQQGRWICSFKNNYFLGDTTCRSLAHIQTSFQSPLEVEAPCRWRRRTCSEKRESLFAIFGEHIRLVHDCLYLVHRCSVFFVLLVSVFHACKVKKSITKFCLEESTHRLATTVLGKHTLLDKTGVALYEWQILIRQNMTTNTHN